MWNHLFERVRAESLVLRDFHLELGLPVWRLRIGAGEIERRVFLPHLQNTVVITYQLLSGAAVNCLTEPVMRLRWESCGALRRACASCARRLQRPLLV